MPAPKGPKQRKVIQKRIIRKERFARMARIRYRKERNALMARVQDIDIPPMYELQNTVYENPLGLMLAEAEEGLYTELTLLNDCYTSNSVTVQNDKTQILSVKLHKNDHKDNLLREQVLDEWENRSNPYWVNWAKHYKNFGTSFPLFLEKNRHRFEAKTLDEEALNKQKEYNAKREEIMLKKACFEMRTRFNEKGSATTEILFNSSFVNRLNYSFEEFIQKILVEGLPRLCPSHNKFIPKNSHLYDHFEKAFNNGYETAYPDSLYLGKNFNITQMDVTLVGGGYFVKNAAEMSFIFACNDSKGYMERETLNRPIYRLYIEQQMSRESERKYFIEMFYQREIELLKKVCQIKELPDEIEEEPKIETDINNTETNKPSEELVVKDNINSCSDSKMIKKALVSVPFTDFLTQLLPQFQQMKNKYEKQQQMLDNLLQKNVKNYMTKIE